MKYLSTFFSLIFIILFSATLSAQADLKKANKQFELAAYNLAINSYQKVLDKDPNNLVALSRTADAYRHLNQMDQAAVWYQKAVEQKGVDPIYTFQYGQVLKALGRYEEAKEWFGVYGQTQPEIGKQYIESADFAMSIQDVPSLYEVKNEYANSKYADFGPAFYNNQVAYASARQDIVRKNKPLENSWSGGAKNQLFLSSIDKNNYLGRPAYLRADLKNSYNEGPISYSKDGRKVAFTKNNFVDGTRQIPDSGMELSIYLADVTSEGDWENAKAFPFNGAGYSSGFPQLSADGNTLYFASNRPDGFGGYDIYVSYRTGTSWSTPENLGPVINSSGDEITPFMSNGDLYFSSNWHHGLGGFDIFRAERVEGVWKNVFHLGNGINSAYDDYSYIYDNNKNRGYIVSNRPGGKGAEDIYRITKSTEELLILVVDKETGKGIPNALIDFTACGEPVFKTDNNGVYRFQALDGLDCSIVVSKDGFRSYNFDLNINKESAQSFEIKLAKEGGVEDYLGKVVSAANNKSVGKVRIKATDQTSGLVLEAMSNEMGDYYLPLDPNRIYLIRFSKAGYLDTHKKVNTGTGVDKSVLGVILLPPSGTSGVVMGGGTRPPGEVVNPTTTVPPPASTGSEGEPIEVVEVVTDTTTVVIPAPAPEPVDEDIIEVQEGFSVQLAAIPLGQDVMPGKYAKMSSEGNVYGRIQGNFKKVRVGIFPTKAEAKAVQAVAKSNGFGSAFIVTERIERLTDMEIYMQMETPSEYSKTMTTPVTSATTISRIKVQIASLKNMANFDPKTVASIGTIETRKKGDFTIILLNGFEDIPAAEAARDAAIQAGYKGAYLVEDKGGVLGRIAK